MTRAAILVCATSCAAGEFCADIAIVALLIALTSEAFMLLTDLAIFTILISPTFSGGALADQTELIGCTFAVCNTGFTALIAADLSIFAVRRSQTLHTIFGLCIAYTIAAMGIIATPSDTRSVFADLSRFTIAIICTRCTSPLLADLPVGTRFSW